MGNTLDLIFANKQRVKAFLSDNNIKDLGFGFDPHMPKSIEYRFDYLNVKNSYKTRVRVNKFLLELGLKTYKVTIPFGLPHWLRNNNLALKVIKEFKNYFVPEFVEFTNGKYESAYKYKDLKIDYSNPVIEGGRIMLGNLSTDLPYNVIVNALNDCWDKDDNKYIRLTKILYQEAI